MQHLRSIFARKYSSRQHFGLTLCPERLFHHCFMLFPSIHFTSLPFLSVSSQLLGSNVHTLNWIFYLGYVAIDHLRPCLYNCDATQHRHRCTSLTGGDDSESGFYLSGGYDSWLLPFQTTSPASPPFRTTRIPSINWAPCEQPRLSLPRQKTPSPTLTSSAGKHTSPHHPSSPFSAPLPSPFTPPSSPIPSPSLRVAEEAAPSSPPLSFPPSPTCSPQRHKETGCGQLGAPQRSVPDNFKHLDVSKVPMLQGLPAPQQEQLITGVVHTLTTYREELHQSYRPDDPPGHSTASSSAPPDHFPSTDPIRDGTGLPLPVPDSASMSLNSTSTESQNTLEPPFPLDRPHD